MLPTCATVDSRWPPPRLHPPSARSARLSSATPRRLVSQHVGSAAGHRQKEAPSHHQLHSRNVQTSSGAPLQSATEMKAAPVRSPRAAAWCRAVPRRALQRQRQASYVSRGSGTLALRGCAPQQPAASGSRPHRMRLEPPLLRRVVLRAPPLHARARQVARRALLRVPAVRHELVVQEGVLDVQRRLLRLQPAAQVGRGAADANPSFVTYAQPCARANATHATSSALGSWSSCATRFRATSAASDTSPCTVSTRAPDGTGFASSVRVLVTCGWRGSRATRSKRQHRARAGGSSDVVR